MSGFREEPLARAPLADDPPAEDHLVEDRHADFTTDIRVLALSGMAVVIGVVSAAVAWVLVWLIAVITNACYYHKWSTVFHSPAASHPGPWTILIPVGGGLIIGLMARYGSDKIRGHGIPEALEAILIGRSRISAKVAILKPVSSAISIGTGGPFGAEGPIIMTGGAFGSLFAQSFHLSPAERKTLLTAGAAGGMAAIFAAPVAAVLLAVELLLFEWKPRSFIPVAISSITAAAVRVAFLGRGPVFPVHPHGPSTGYILGVALVVGLIGGFASGAVTRLVYAFEDGFGKLPIHWMWWPAIGGVVVGVGGLINPRTLGVGYDTIADLLNGRLIGMALISLCVVKAIIWACALGSGTSGGVLAPLLIMGGALGALEAHVIPIGDVGLWATISMAAMMGGTMRAPFTAVLFTVELTHDYNLLPALLLACVGAHAVTVLLLPRDILTEKVARRGHHISREYEIDPLTLLRVGEVMVKNVPVVPATLKVTELANRIARGDAALASFHGVPVLDSNNKLVGMITHGDVLRAVQEDPATAKTVLDAGTPRPLTAYPDETLAEAVLRMVQHGVGRLPVVSRDAPDELIGYLGRSGIMEARMRLAHEENDREATPFLRISRLRLKDLARRTRLSTNGSDATDGIHRSGAHPPEVAVSAAHGGDADH